MFKIGDMVRRTAAYIARQKAGSFASNPRDAGVVANGDDVFTWVSWDGVTIPHHHADLEYAAAARPNVVDGLDIPTLERVLEVMRATASDLVDMGLGKVTGGDYSRVLALLDLARENNR